jgi:hypothetical protein
MLTVDLDAERAVLGSLIQFPEFYGRVSWLTPDMFTEPRHKVILPAVRESARLDRDEIPDRLGIIDELRKAGALTRDPGLGVYLSDLPSRQWVIPGLLSRGERVIVVASEGAGKTMVARAVAIGCASGRHPFNVDVPIPPVKTLLADLENPDDVIQETSGPMVGMMRNKGIWQVGNCHILHRPGGLDLRKATDQRELERAIQQTSPEIVCLGPIYKTFSVAGGEKEEQAARDVALYFDRLRERYNVAFWLEHHAPLEQNGQRALRPIGTSLWQRWPEFGISLRKQKDTPGDSLAVEHWRGERARGREWPNELWPRSPDGWTWRAHWAGGEPNWMTRAKTQGNVGADIRGAS